MKPFPLFASGACCVILALPLLLYADDFTLNDGTQYKNVQISRVEPDGIVVTTNYGVIKLFFIELPKEIQEKYHYDPKQAEAFRFRLDAAKAAATEDVTAAEERRRELNRTSEINAEQPGKTRPNDQTELIRGLSLEAHEIGTADGFQSYWETNWGSFDRDYARGKRILVTVRDISRKVRKCEVNVYFIARPVFQSNVHFIYDHARFFPGFRGRIEVSGPVAARDLHARILNLALLGKRYGKGADMDGWIAVGTLGGRTFGVRASSQTLLEIAQDSGRQPETLTQLIAEYEGATSSD